MLNHFEVGIPNEDPYILHHTLTKLEAVAFLEHSEIGQGHI